MTIKELFEKVGGLPELVIIQTTDGDNLWIGNQNDLTPGYLETEFDKACTHIYSDRPCVAFYLKKENVNGKD